MTIGTVDFPKPTAAETIKNLSIELGERDEHRPGALRVYEGSVPFQEPCSPGQVLAHWRLIRRPVWRDGLGRRRSNRVIFRCSGQHPERLTPLDRSEVGPQQFGDLADPADAISVKLILGLLRGSCWSARIVRSRDRASSDGLSESVERLPDGLSHGHAGVKTRFRIGETAFRIEEASRPRQLLLRIASL
jgi:hypothetical protein